MAILVCGGAGYIGSHVVRALRARGDEVVVIDSLRTGHAPSVPKDVPFYKGDIRVAEDLEKIFKAHEIEAVLHFCACSLVGESVLEPLMYFNNNVSGMVSLLESMTKFGIDKIVFSSSAAVYGEPERVPILETDTPNPTNPYGETKLMMERIMRWVSDPRANLAKHPRYVSLRYFNVAGAWHDGSIGEDHRNETHLVPIILQVPLGKRPHVTVFGDDYPTPDGTCIRDYVHVEDLADAHLKALDYLRSGGESRIFNLGSGDGYSVKTMVEAAREATGHAIPVEMGARRAGDPARLVADSTQAEKILGWKPKITSMTDIVASAWKWHQSHPQGYAPLED